MAVKINNTQNLENGPYYIPSETDVGRDFVKWVEIFMARMAVHTHNNVDALLGADSIPAFTLVTGTPSGNQKQLTWGTRGASTGLFTCTEINIGSDITTAPWLFLAVDQDIGNGVETFGVVLAYKKGSTANHLIIESNFEFTKLIATRVG